jgi:LuxR family transcriptional regulator, maltose regulon positive regulatory protein
MALDSLAERGNAAAPLFATAKFRPLALPSTLVVRPGLNERLAAGAGKRLTVVVGSAGAGKSVLLSSWASARPDGLTAWLSCDEADANPVRFWAGFAAAVRVIDPEFGADATELLAIEGVVSADVMASMANDAAKLPAGSAIIVDDFHDVGSAVSADMTDLVERWPSPVVQLVLSARSDPAVRLHRLRMSDALCELRDRDLCFSLDESRDLLANFGVEVTFADLARLHHASEGWAAALQMAALSIRGASDSSQLAHAFDLRKREIADYFVSEVLDRQPAEMAQFMLDTSVLGELTPDACTGITGRQDAASLLRTLDATGLFLVALDEERTSFRYHHLVHQVLHAELRARDRAREQDLQLRAAEWFESAGGGRRAARHYLAAGQAERALGRLQDCVAAEFLQVPELSPPPDLGAVAPALLASAPERLLSLAVDLLVSGDVTGGCWCLELIDRAGLPAEPDPRLAARLAGTRALGYWQTGHLDHAVSEARAARQIIEEAELTDEWVSMTTAVLGKIYAYLGDYEEVEREAARAARDLAGPVARVAVPGGQAVAWLDYGNLAKAAEAAVAADEGARALGFGQHFFAVDYLRALAGLALERRDLDAAERLTERALSISERRRPVFEFLALLDRAAIWATRGQVREALPTVASARDVLAGSGSVLLERADELEAALRLSLGDLRCAAELAGRLQAVPRSLLLARIGLAAGHHASADQHVRALPRELTPRRAMQRRVIQAGAAISRADPKSAAMVADVVDAARREGFRNTVVTTAAQLTGYLIEHSTHVRADPFMEQLIAAALETRAVQPTLRPQPGLAEPLTDAELRVLKLLPTSTYVQMADTLYISRNTVKTHLRSIYRKLIVASRSEAIERAVDLQLLLPAGAASGSAPPFVGDAPGRRPAEACCHAARTCGEPVRADRPGGRRAGRRLRSSEPGGLASGCVQAGWGRGSV